MPSRLVPGDGAVAAAVNDQVTAVPPVQGGATVLAVWSDNRANSTGGYEGETLRGTSTACRFGRVRPSSRYGAVLRSAAGLGSQKSPRASWNGANWLVSSRASTSAERAYYQTSLEALRVAPDGHVLDPKPIKLYNMTPSGRVWAVASDGSGWVVVEPGDFGQQ